MSRKNNKNKSRARRDKKNASSPEGSANSTNNHALPLAAENTTGQAASVDVEGAPSSSLNSDTQSHHRVVSDSSTLVNTSTPDTTPKKNSSSSTGTSPDGRTSPESPKPRKTLAQYKAERAAKLNPSLKPKDNVDLSDEAKAFYVNARIAELLQVAQSSTEENESSQDKPTKDQKEENLAHQNEVVEEAAEVTAEVEKASIKAVLEQIDFAPANIDHQPQRRLSKGKSSPAGSPRRTKSTASMEDVDIPTFTPKIDMDFTTSFKGVEEQPASNDTNSSPLSSRIGSPKISTALESAVIQSLKGKLQEPRRMTISDQKRLINPPEKFADLEAEAANGADISCIRWVRAFCAPWECAWVRTEIPEKVQDRMLLKDLPVRFLGYSPVTGYVDYSKEGLKDGKKKLRASTTSASRKDSTSSSSASDCTESDDSQSPDITQLPDASHSSDASHSADALHSPNGSHSLEAPEDETIPETIHNIDDPTGVTDIPEPPPKAELAVHCPVPEKGLGAVQDEVSNENGVSKEQQGGQEQEISNEQDIPSNEEALKEAEIPNDEAQSDENSNDDHQLSNDKIEKTNLPPFVPNVGDQLCCCASCIMGLPNEHDPCTTITDNGVQQAWNTYDMHFGQPKSHHNVENSAAAETPVVIEKAGAVQEEATDQQSLDAHNSNDEGGVEEDLTPGVGSAEGTAVIRSDSAPLATEGTVEELVHTNVPVDSIANDPSPFNAVDHAYSASSDSETEHEECESIKQTMAAASISGEETRNIGSATVLELIDNIDQEIYHHSEAAKYHLAAVEALQKKRAAILSTSGAR
ncbi:hypothetical protein NA57DRAFT_62340 [Rhizodiscina lignyota]|uniref:Uncharacterized protein n=1 Tax=Rhizodiscina lignyota TaxID=1504668 RepID=A0A9P4I0D3_9PEZI|nr:hypothetical protein NA57DRAFT_62340 [Rhizodiscina lignyota]